MALKFPAVVDKLNQLNWDWLARQFPLSVDKLAAAVQAQLLKPGMIMATGRSSADTGFLLCDGTAVSRTTYSALFAAISTTYGVGDGSTTFNLPDLRGRVPAGAGTGTGGGASGNGLPTGGSALTARARGDWAGGETHTLTAAQIPAHTHPAPATLQFAYTQAVAQTAAGADFAAINGFESATRDNTGGGGAHNNMQPLQIVNFEIKT